MFACLFSKCTWTAMRMLYQYCGTQNFITKDIETDVVSTVAMKLTLTIKLKHMYSLYKERCRFNYIFVGTL